MGMAASTVVSRCLFAALVAAVATMFGGVRPLSLRSVCETPETSFLTWCGELLLFICASLTAWLVYAPACRLLSRQPKPEGASKATPRASGSDSGARSSAEFLEREESAQKVDNSPHIKIIDLRNGETSRSNPEAPTTFELPTCSGAYVLLHRKVDGDTPDAFSSYFEGKLRLWEVRIQLTFKKEVKASDLKFASGPLDWIPVGVAQIAMHRTLLKMMGPVTRGFRNTPGDNPEGKDPDDVEPAMTSIGVTESDQHIMSARGEVPPKLLDRYFPSLGRRKTSDRSGYRAHLQDLVFKAGETHTFGFWGLSRFVNLIRWQISGLPMMKAFSVDSVNGKPPLVMSLYILGPPRTDSWGRQDQRHVKGRMEILFQLAMWSSIFPPSPERLRKMRGMAQIARSTNGASLSTEHVATVGRRGGVQLPLAGSGHRIAVQPSQPSCWAGVPRPSLGFLRAAACCVTCHKNKGDQQTPASARSSSRPRPKSAQR